MHTALGIAHFACAALYVGLAYATPKGRVRRLMIAPLLVVLGVGWLLD